MIEGESESRELMSMVVDCIEITGKKEVVKMMEGFGD